MKPLQGNLDFFLIRATRGPFRLKHETQGSPHIHIPKGKLLLRCLRKMAYLFSRRQGISSHLQTIWGARVFHPVALLKLMFLYTEMCVSGNLWIVVKDVKTLVVYDVEYEMSMDSMNGKCASS